MSLAGTVKDTAKKLKNSVRRIIMEPVHDEEGNHNGHMLNHEMHDYEHEENGKNYYLKTPVHVAKHIKACKYCNDSMGKGNKPSIQE